MKKILFSICAAALILTGCTPKTPEPVAVAPIGIDVAVHIENTHDYFENQPDDKDKLFRSYEQLRDFIENTVGPSYSNGIPSGFSRYDEEFFETHSLYYTACEFTTGSVSFQAEDANAFIYENYESGEKTISISVPAYYPEVGTDDMAYFCFFAELPQVDENTIVELSWYE